jgi:hypothetical protein
VGRNQNARWNKKAGAAGKKKGDLDLALDVDHCVGCGLGLLKQLAGFASQQPHRPVLLLQQFGGGVFNDESGSLLIGLEAKFFCDEADVHVGFVPAGKISFQARRDMKEGRLTLYR